MNIQFGQHHLILHQSGVLLWPGQNLLIVSDLHLEKGSHYARRGFFLPPYDSHETLMRLLGVLEASQCSRLLVLGDCFHDMQGYQRLGAEDREIFERLHRFSPIWIRGNHDGQFVPEGFRSYDDLELNGLIFRHEAQAQESGYEISGHYHPKLTVSHKGAMVSSDCFLEDGRKIILPAFGAYTGGLDVHHPSIRNLMGEDMRAYALGKERVYNVI